LLQELLAIILVLLKLRQVYSAFSIFFLQNLPFELRVPLIKLNASKEASI